jgi:hypothetical protein
MLLTPAPLDPSINNESHQVCINGSLNPTSIQITNWDSHDSLQRCFKLYIKIAKCTQLPLSIRSCSGIHTPQVVDMKKLHILRRRWRMHVSRCPRSITIEKMHTTLDIKITECEEQGNVVHSPYVINSYTPLDPSIQQLLQTGMHQWIRQSNKYCIQITALSVVPYSRAEESLRHRFTASKTASTCLLVSAQVKLR